MFHLLNYPTRCSINSRCSLRAKQKKNRKKTKTNNYSTNKQRTHQIAPHPTSITRPSKHISKNYGGLFSRTRTSSPPSVEDNFFWLRTRVAMWNANPQTTSATPLTPAVQRTPGAHGTPLETTAARPTFKRISSSRQPHYSM